MVSSIAELFKQDWTVVILGIFIFMMGIVAIADIIGKFSKIIGKPLKWVKNKDEDHEAIDDLEHEMKQYAENRKRDRAQSFQIQKELVDAQTKISDLVNDISVKLDKLKRDIDKLKTDTDKRFDLNEEKENKRVQAEIKEKIALSYRQYNATKTISNMEFEALEDLIATYEAHGGENSFVHSVVQKEMYTWKRII